MEPKWLEDYLKLLDNWMNSQSDLDNEYKDQAKVYVKALILAGIGINDAPYFTQIKNWGLSNADPLADKLSRYAQFETTVIEAPQKKLDAIKQATSAGEKGDPYPFAALDGDTWEAYMKAYNISYLGNLNQKATQKKADAIYQATLAGQQGQPYPYSVVDNESWNAYQQAVDQRSANQASAAQSEWQVQHGGATPEELRRWGVSTPYAAQWGAKGLEEARAADIATTEANRLGAMWKPTEPQVDNAASWDSAKQTLLSELSASNQPRNWITQWKTEHTQNPHRPVLDEGQQLQENLKKADTELKNATASLSDLNKRKTDNYTTVDNNEILAANLRYDNALAIKQGLEQRATQRETQNAGQQDWGTPREVGNGNFAVGQPTQESWQYTGLPKPSTTPPVTDIRQFLGGNKQFGASIETPSGQTWAASPWATREKLWGYADYLKQNPENILSQMNMMQPNAPNTPNYWQPKRQR